MQKFIAIVVALIGLYEVYGDRGEETNVLGKPLKVCSMKPKTGWHRNGYCLTDENDTGTHVVCSRVTNEFLQFSKSKGNDLIDPVPEYDFPGLKNGDYWCLCALRWLEAHREKKAPPVYLEATYKKATDFVPVDLLRKYDVKKTD